MFENESKCELKKDIQVFIIMVRSWCVYFIWRKLTMTIEKYAIMASADVNP